MSNYPELAREQIVETVMLFGCYPQPRRVGLFFTSGSRKPEQFSLTEFLFDTAGKTYIDPRELEDFFVSALIDHSTIGAFSDCRNRWEKKVEKMLNDHFTDNHPLVQEVAAKMESDDRENHAA